MKCAGCGRELGEVAAEASTGSDFPVRLVFVDWEIAVCSPSCSFEAGGKVNELFAAAHPEAAPPKVGQPRCTKCGEFLSPMRVEMRLTVCAHCDTSHRRR